jgi:hypothetical protein
MPQTSSAGGCVTATSMCLGGISLCTERTGRSLLSEFLAGRSRQLSSAPRREPEFRDGNGAVKFTRLLVPFTAGAGVERGRYAKAALGSKRAAPAGP